MDANLSFTIILCVLFISIAVVRCCHWVSYHKYFYGQREEDEANEQL